MEGVQNFFAQIESKKLKPDKWSFSIAIRACAIDGDVRRALFLFDKMQHRYWLHPDVYTYSSLLTACGTAKDLNTACKSYNEMIASGLCGDVFTLTALLDVYAECCNEDNGKTYLETCLEYVDKAREAGIQENRKTYTSLIKLCMNSKLTKESLGLFELMKERGLKPDQFAYITVLVALSKDTEMPDEYVLETALALFEEMKFARIQPEAQVYTALIGVAFRAKNLQKATNFFKQMKKNGIKPRIETFGMLLKCYEKLGRLYPQDKYLQPCLDLLVELEQEGLTLDAEISTTLLNACSNAANLGKALEIWQKMISHGLQPGVSQYNVIIKVSLINGDTQKATQFFEEMKLTNVVPNQLTYGLWLNFFAKQKDRLSAQRIQKEMEGSGIQPDEYCMSQLRELKQV